MSALSYQSDTGETLWKAYISVRSKLNPSIRVQRWKFGLKTEKQAERAEGNLESECRAEVLRQEKQGATWGSLVDEWDEHLAKERSQELSEVTRTDYLSALRKHTASWWDEPAAGISRADVLEALAQMKAHSSSVSYQNKFKVILNRIFIFGIDYRLIRGLERSPAHGISLGREEEKMPEILKIEEIKRLLHEARELDHPWYSIWATALLTGMRNGELYALLWTDVDFGNREIAVTKSYNCRKRIVKSTKAGYWRTVPISGELLTLLKELKATAGDRPEVLPRTDRWKEGEQAKKLREFCQGIGLPSVKFHTLRACFATQLIRNAVPPIQLQKICGWKDLETMQRYIRLAGIEVKGATESLKVLPDFQVFEIAAALLPSKTLGEKVGISSDQNGVD